MQRTRTWDIFCKVIDNFGDIGVCWRLACNLAERGQRVRLWVDDASALQWMASPVHMGGVGEVSKLEVEIRAWTATAPKTCLDAQGDVVIEGFGCDAPAEYVAARYFAIESIAACAYPISASGLKGTENKAANRALSQPSPVWINLEYLSAEAYVARSHGLCSPVHQGPAIGLNKWFFYPGFMSGTGGLLRELDLPERLAHFDRAAWRASHRIAPQALAVSLFCYEPAALPELLVQLSGMDQLIQLTQVAQREQPEQTAQAGQLTPLERLELPENAMHMTPAANALQPSQRVDLLVTPGRATLALQAAIAHFESKNSLQPLWNVRKQLSFLYQQPVHQGAFDEMLWACDLNFVRGEDSLVRALWAGQPLVWQVYPQTDGAHAAKLTAFLDWLQAPPSLRQFHAVWNGLSSAALPALTHAMLLEWQNCVLAARARLWAQPDLATQLLDFVEEKATARS